MLYDPARHTKIDHHNFDPDLILKTIQNIVDTTVQVGLQSDKLWPIHPKDHFDGCPEFFTDFYMGAAGTLWALWELSAYAKMDLNDFLRTKIDQTLKFHINFSETDSQADKGAYFVGEAGVRAVKEKLNPNPSNKNELRKLIQGKIHSDQNELLYGLPGVLLLANFIYEPNESDSINVMLDQMLSTREMDSQSNALVWSQNFAGKKLQFLGVAHGTVGNFSIILEVLAKKGRQKRLEAISNLEKILKTYAQIDQDCCNWPVSLQITSLKQDTVKPLVHWCHGATGVVTALATKISKVESELIHDLLLKAGNLIWKAGPLEKGISLCHGTAGSGMAMLKLFERTGDRLWLEQAQAFAMHAIHQHQVEANNAKQLRFSLWTGDLGLALFLRDVLKKSSSAPGMDMF